MMKPANLKYTKLLQGFTLLELLVVIVIIGIILTFATLSIHQSDAKSQMTEAAQRLAAVLTLASQEAILQGQEMGVYFEQTGYRFYRLESDAWQIQEDIMRPYVFQSCIEAQLEVEGESVVLESTVKKIPQVVLFSSGEMTPFTITLTCIVDERYTHNVTGMANGTIEIVPHEKIN